MTDVQGLNSVSVLARLNADQELMDSLKLGNDPAARIQKLAVLVSDVAVTKLGGKKSKRSYRLRFRVKLRETNGVEDIRWVTIVTKKQDLKSSLRCVKAFQGLARHLRLATYNRRFGGQNVGMQMFEIGQWMQRGGTQKYALRIKREKTDGSPDPVWVTWRINPASFFGGVPLLPHDDDDPQESSLKPKHMFVALSEKSPVQDLESQLPPGAGFWAYRRESIRWKNVKRSGSRLIAGVPMVGPALSNKLPISDTFDKRIEKLTKIAQWLIDHNDKNETRGVHDEVRNAFNRYQSQEETNNGALLDEDVFPIFGYTPPTAIVPDEASDDSDNSDLDDGSLPSAGSTPTHPGLARHSDGRLVDDELDRLLTEQPTRVKDPIIGNISAIGNDDL